MTIFVVAKDGTKLMPTTNIKKVRGLLKSKRARIIGHHPFTIQLDYETTKYIQPVEFKEDTGDRHIGMSICSKKHEYASAQYDHLSNEKKPHDSARKHRRIRRDRKRHRKPRFDNRAKRTPSKDGKWFAPSLKNKELNHLRVMERYSKVCPIKEAWLECGSFDTQTLQAVEAGEPSPKGDGFQKGPRYGYDTLREAVFARDKHTCICCGKGIDDGRILRIHHLGFKTGDHTDRMSNLATVCTVCHTPSAHRPGGKLYDLGPTLRPFKGASFMTSVRFQLIKDAKAMFPDIDIHMCYGAATKRERHSRRMEKTHANDAYCMGNFHPKHRSPTRTYQKRRRNDRVIESFHDAVYVDMRDGSERKGSELSTNRTDRKVPRDNPNNLRGHRGRKISKGVRAIRKQRHDIRPGSIVTYKGREYEVHGMQNNGKTLSLNIERRFTAEQLQPKLNKNKEALPIAAGQKLALVGKKEKHTVLSVKDNIVTMQWYMGVKPEQVIVNKGVFSGWICVDSTKAM